MLDGVADVAGDASAWEQICPRHHQRGSAGVGGEIGRLLGAGIESPDGAVVGEIAFEIAVLLAVLA
jgi:hypothetical protein